MIALDFTRADTLRKLAALPFYGYAEAIVRRVDPYWHAPPPPYSYKVHLCHFKQCRCCEQSVEKSKTVIIEAADQEDAERFALRENKGWFVAAVDHPKFPTAPIPPDLMNIFEVAA